MNPIQFNELTKVVPLLTECREHLDTIMYYSGPLDETEFTRIRAIYDKICETLDLM